MSFSYYKLLFFSLAITLGLYLLFRVYRNYVRRTTMAAGSPRGFARMLPLEIPREGGELQFRFAIDGKLPVVLEVCNSDYKTLHVIADKVYEAGEHVVRFNPEGLGKGVFFYKLKTNKQEIIKKFELEG